LLIVQVVICAVIRSVSLQSGIITRKYGMGFGGQSIEIIRVDITISSNGPNHAIPIQFSNPEIAPIHHKHFSLRVDHNFIHASSSNDHNRFVGKNSSDLVETWVNQVRAVVWGWKHAGDAGEVGFGGWTIVSIDATDECGKIVGGWADGL